MKRIISFITAILIGSCVYAQGSNSTWRDITPEEEAYCTKLEQRMTAILTDAANKMPGNWDEKFHQDNFQRKAIDGGQHDNRFHELRFTFDVEYKPTEEEQGRMEAAINKHGEIMAPLYNGNNPPSEDPDNPIFAWNIHVNVVFNYYGWTPRNVNDIVALGRRENIPGTVFANLRIKQTGIEAPIYVLYMGDYAISNGIIKETCGVPKKCTDAKTLMIEISSNEKTGKQFINNLDIAAINKVLQEI